MQQHPANRLLAAAAGLATVLLDMLMSLVVTRTHTRVTAVHTTVQDAHGSMVRRGAEHLEGQ